MTAQPSLSFFARLWLAFLCFWRVLFSQAFAQTLAPLSRAYDAGTLPEHAGERPPPTLAAPPPVRDAGAALSLLTLLQREGRLVDFLQEEVAAFSDAEVGAAARIVHEGCRKVVKQYLELAPVLPQAEGERVQVPAGFDAQRIRLTGNISGAPPYAGALKHHGWVVVSLKLPEPNAAVDLNILAPAEVEL